MRDRGLNDHCFASDFSSFNRNGFDSSFSQSAHHTVRLSARENIKSASLSAQQQTASKLQEKLKCVIDFFISSLFRFAMIFWVRFLFIRLKSDRENQQHLCHHRQQRTIQVRFEFTRVNIIRLLSSKIGRRQYRRLLIWSWKIEKKISTKFSFFSFWD